MAKGALIEQRSIDYVPYAERHGKVWHLWPVWFSGSAHLATPAVGVIGIMAGANLLWTGIAVLLGCALGTFFMAFHSTQGPQLGLPQMIQSRPQFGYRGALLVWGVALVAYIGYNAFNQVLCAQAMHQLVPALAKDSPTVIVGFTTLALSLAVAGYDKIHFAQRAFAYLMIAILVVVTIGGALTIHIPADQWEVRPLPVVPFITQLFAAAAYQLSWSIYVSDYSRYLPANVGVRASFWWTAVGAFIGGAWTMLIGSLAAALYRKEDLPAAMQLAADSVLPHLGTVLLVGAILGLVMISALNFYGASLTLLSVLDTLKPLRSSAAKRVQAVLVAAVAATVIALSSSDRFIQGFGELLAVLLYLFTPWTAINLVDFYVVRDGHYSIREIFNPNGLYGRWNWRGLVAYAVGFVVMIPFFSTDHFKGFVARALGGADLSMLVGLPVAAGVYYIACRGVDFDEESRRARAADAGLEPEPSPAPHG